MSRYSWRRRRLGLGSVTCDGGEVCGSCFTLSSFVYLFKYFYYLILFLCLDCADCAVISIVGALGTKVHAA